MLEFDLHKMARHLVDRLEINREIITTEDGSLAFQSVEYGETNVVLTWPHLSVMPIRKTRQLELTRKYRIEFEIHLILYHAQVAKMTEIQEGAHDRAEALELFINSDRKWNFVDAADDTKDKVVHGHVTSLDHPVVFLGENNLWSTSRLTLEAMSQEAF